VVSLSLALFAVVGLTMGLLGGGGGVLTVPILTIVAGYEAKQAIATSLFVVGLAAVAGVVMHARAGRVRWRTGYLFGTAGMFGAFLGGNLARFVPGAALLAMFALLMGAGALVMLRPRRAAASPATPARDLPPLTTLLKGAAVGLLAAMVGAGGGFLIVPVLVLGGLPMHAAVGTSLLVIAMQSAAGLASHLGHVSLDWPVATAMTAIAIAGLIAGALLSGRVPHDRLRRGFGWFLVVMAAFVLTRQLPVAWPFSLAGFLVIVCCVVAIAARRVDHDLPPAVR
jgi:uncharacterized membrane protein YfcA